MTRPQNCLIFFLVLFCGSNVPHLSGDLLLHYTFEDQSDPTLNIGTLGESYNGELFGNAAFEPFEGGFALSLDGDVSDGSVVIPLGDESAFDIGDSDFSLLATFQTTFFNDELPNVRALVWKQGIGGGVGPPNFGFGVRQNNGRGLFFLNDNLTTISVQSNSVLNDGFTHTLMAIRNGSVIGLFVDGTLEATAAIPAGFGTVNNDQPLVIGGRTLLTNDDFAGLIDEIQVHDTALEAVPLLGDINLDNRVDLLDVSPFIELLTNGDFQAEADINQDEQVNLLDVGPFVDILSGG